MKIAKLLIGLLLIGSHQALVAREITIAFGMDRPPYVFGDEGRGLEIDLVRAALAAKGHTLKVVSRSNSRMLADLLQGNVDGAATVSPTADGAFFSDTFVVFENYAITFKSPKRVINKIADLKSFSIAAWQGAHHDLGPEFKKLFNPDVREPYILRYHEIESQLSQNLMFWKGRIQVIIVDRTIFSWFRNELSKSADTSQEVEFHNIFPMGTSHRIAFHDAKIRDEFNEGLTQIRKSGRYKKFYEAYIGGPEKFNQLPRSTGNADGPS